MQHLVKFILRGSYQVLPTCGIPWEYPPYTDYRPNIHNFEQTDPIAGNYWPIASRVRISDTDKSDGTELTLFGDRPHGGGSLMVGSLEIMVQRRINNSAEQD